MINQVRVRPCDSKTSTAYFIKNGSNLVIGKNLVLVKTGLMSYQVRVRLCDCKNTTAGFTESQAEHMLVRNSLTLSRITLSKKE